MRYGDDIEAFKADRDIEHAREGWLIDAAFSDLLQGKFETENVHLAMKLGHHQDYAQLKELYDVALQVARHAGAAR